ncbi:MAG: Uma2 family endonuclease [Gemmataceae bacterium]
MSATTEAMSFAPPNPPSVGGEFQESLPLKLRLSPALNLSSDQFFEIAAQNEMLRLERTADGELLIMAPAGAESSSFNVEVIVQVAIWSATIGGGKVFDSSAGFLLPNGATRSPDVSWISEENLSQVTEEQLRKYPPIAPDFVAEIISPSDSVKQTMEKMTEYVSNGVRFGIMLNPRNFSASVYRPNANPIVLQNPANVSCEPELAGLILDMNKVWPRPQ